MTTKNVSTGVVVTTGEKSMFAEQHRNFDETITRFKMALTQGDIAKAKSIIGAVVYKSETKMKEGKIEESNFAATLAEKLLEIDAEYVRYKMIPKELKTIALAQRNLITCYPVNNRGYKGCGGQGMMLDLMPDKSVEQRTCKVCGGTGVIERTREARELLERIEANYGSVGEYVTALLEEQKTNAFAVPF